MPEFFICLISLIHHHPGIMAGDIIGSNIANVGLILPIAFFIYPVFNNDNILSRDVVVMCCATIVFILFLANGKINRIEGALLLIGAIAYHISLIHSSRLKKSTQFTNMETAKTFLKKSYHHWQNFLWMVVGISGLFLSARLIISSAVNLAFILGISNVVISLSVVAFSTALPELGMAIISAYRKQNDLLIGNIIGSNIYNLLFVSGFSTMIAPLNVNKHVITDNLLALAFFSLIPLLFITKRQINRIHCSIVLAVYLGFIVWIYY